MAASFSVGISHPGTSADLARGGRSFVKENLRILNIRTGHRTVAGVANPYTDTEVDGLSNAKLGKAVRMILRHHFEADAKAFDERVAQDAFVNPISGRGDQTEIDDTID